MLNNKDMMLQYLSTLNLTRDEAKVYLELLREPLSHLELSRKTGVNRSKVYRLADQLEKRSLVTSRTDDRGTFLVAEDPATLEVALVTEEEKLKQQRVTFDKLLPALSTLQKTTDHGKEFTISTYEGVEGFKQMLWHELKAKDEVLVFGNGRIQDLVDNERWAEKHRLMTIKAGYHIRELQNPGKRQKSFTQNQTFFDYYTERSLDPNVMDMEQQLAIYNDTVATYSWRDGRKVGFEVVNASHTNMMRQMFEHYWELAG